MNRSFLRLGLGNEQFATFTHFHFLRTQSYIIFQVDYSLEKKFKTNRLSIFLSLCKIWVLLNKRPGKRICWEVEIFFHKTSQTKF